MDNYAVLQHIIPMAVRLLMNCVKLESVAKAYN